MTPERSVLQHSNSRVREVQSQGGPRASYAELFCCLWDIPPARIQAETPGHEITRHFSPCLIPGRLYQMGGYPVLKYGPGIVCGDLFELPWNFDFKIFDVYEDYHPTRPWAVASRRRISDIAQSQRMGLFGT